MPNFAPEDRADSCGIEIDCERVLEGTRLWFVTGIRTRENDEVRFLQKTKTRRHRNSIFYFVNT